jgi:hypothetical protein
MATLAKATPFALRNLPSPEEWRKRKVALISGVSSSTRFARRLTFLVVVFGQASLAKMGLICECYESLV